MEKCYRNKNVRSQKSKMEKLKEKLALFDAAEQSIFLHKHCVVYRNEKGEDFMTN